MILTLLVAGSKNKRLIAGGIQYHPLVLGKEEMGLGLIYGREGQIGLG